jgi:hypothetical protein
MIDRDIAGLAQIGPRRRDQRLAAIRQHQQQLDPAVPSHPAQHLQLPPFQRVSPTRDHHRRKVLDAGSESGLRSTRSTTPR